MTTAEKKQLDKLEKAADAGASAYAKAKDHLEVLRVEMKEKSEAYEIRRKELNQVVQEKTRKAGMAGVHKTIESAKKKYVRENRPAKTQKAKA